MSLSARVLLGLGLGVLTGIFFGEKVAFLAGVGRAFVVLLQMTVLPYVVVALVHSLGRLRPTEARSLTRNVGIFLLLIWGVTLGVVVAFPVVFPRWESASFFSTSLVQAAPRFDPVALYLPSNPFASLANGVVPAVVVFSVAVGLALMATKQKGALIESLGTLENALQRVAGFVVGLAPYGVFAITADAAGTLRGNELLGLQVYAAGYVVAALVLALWILPALVASLTPFSYRQVVGHARAAYLTAFATGSVFVVLPLLAQASKELLESREPTRDKSGQVDVIVPIAFTLASAGKLLSLSFVLFAGWLSGFPVPPTRLPEFLVTGVASFFASTAVAVPFLLDLFRIPADTFQLFLIADNVVGNRFGSMLASVHILSLALLGACGAAGVVTFRRLPLVRWAGVAIVLVLVGFGGIRLGFDAVDHPYEGYQNFVDRSLLLPAAHARELEGPEPLGAAPGPALERIRSRGAVRVGWRTDSLPFVFHNSAGVLVGFDVEMANALARDLAVQLELVRIDAETPRQALVSGAIDVFMAGLAITPHRLEEMAFSDPYLEETLCLVVPDYRRDEFSSREAVLAHESLRLGIPKNSYYADKIRRYLPQAELVPLASPRQFFQTAHEELDGLVFGAESGSAWTLIYPAFSVAVPQPDPLQVPMGYAVRLGDPDFVTYLNRWILLKQRDRTIERLFAYWFEGKAPPGASPPRWSVLRDVLGWDDQTDAQ
jgi:proton glutamate symport protein